jgi:GTP-binding protein
MALTDEIKIKIHAGKGGDGVVAFDKIMMSLGPTGGRGGNGGNVYFEGVSDLTALNKYKHKNDYYAGNGKRGKTDKSSGHNGADLLLTVPIGSVLHNLNTGKEIDITKVGQRVLAGKGGIGGRGNFYFRSPKNTSPKEFETGKFGEEYMFFLELRMIADVGLIGLPNAGKSSLLNEITNANAKVANYFFTTLEPNLGVMDGLIIADIPGLIEGASRGKGLGIKFLKHIQRTDILVHCISCESRNIEKDYKIIRNELTSYKTEFFAKKELLLLTKTDLLDSDKIQKKSEELKKINKNTLAVSVYDLESIEKFKKSIKKLVG